jgi:hypothetical protein
MLNWQERVPQAELPVTRGIAVIVGQRLHPALQPRALVDERCERRRRHCCGGSTGFRGCGGCGLPSIAGCSSDEVFGQANDAAASCQAVGPRTYSAGQACAPHPSIRDSLVLTAVTSEDHFSAPHRPASPDRAAFTLSCSQLLCTQNHRYRCARPSMELVNR